MKTWTHLLFKLGTEAPPWIWTLQTQMFRAGLYLKQVKPSEYLVF